MNVLKVEGVTNSSANQCYSTVHTEMASELVHLATVILQSAKVIDEYCKATSTNFPRLDDPFDPKSSAVCLDPAIVAATSRLLSASFQIIATTQPPAQSILDCAYGFLLSSALRTTSVAGVADVLAEAGPDGIHVEEIAKKTRTDPSKLGRIMRPLTTRHIFREIAPDVFVHNRISSLLTSGRSLEATQERPQDKYQGIAGIFAIVEWLTDEVFKGAAYFTETLLEPSTSHSFLPTQSAFNKAFDVDVDVFEWYERPGNEMRFQRFSMAMMATRGLSPPDTILKGFQWSSIPSDSHVVDVGGGVGSTSLPISKQFPSLKVTIQDRPAVLAQAKQYWTSHLPEAISRGAVNFEGHDFFAAQSHQNVAVFILRYILHDWSDGHSLKILENLRQAASATTKLLIIEFLLPELYPIGASTNSILKFEGPAVRPYMADLMTAIFNGRERTQKDISSLLEKGGWAIEAIYTPPGSLERHIVAAPVCGAV
jgi:hypothetical protein